MSKSVIIFLTICLSLVQTSSGFMPITPKVEIQKNHYDILKNSDMKQREPFRVGDMKSDSISQPLLERLRLKILYKSWMTTKNLLHRLGPPVSLLSLALCFFPQNANASVSQIGSSIPKLALREISMAFSILLTVLLSLTLLRIDGLPGQLLFASFRCGAQVYIMGAAIVSFLFQNNKPGMFALWLVTVSFIAANETSSRIKHTYRQFPIHVLLSIILGTGITLGSAILGVLKTNPWWDTKVVIPMGGLLLGNILATISLCSATLLEELSERSEKVEQLLCMGATSMEASRPALTKALTTALIPKINSLSACGTIHIPGMMAGQLLAGNSAQAAAMYQIISMYLITSSAVTTILILSAFILSSVFDRKQHLIRPRLIERRGQKNKDSRNIFSRIFTEPHHFFFGKETTSLPQYIMLGPGSGTNNIPLLKVENVTVSRTNHNMNFDLFEGQRVALTGSSGIGKSQLLRTLALLESSSSNPNYGKMSLFDPSKKDSSTINTCLWRQRVCYIPQKLPNMSGTPRDIYTQIQKLNLRKKIDESSLLNVTDIAKDWSLPDGILDRPWSTLSGGQAQRIYLAIVISFKPNILLLDEPTSACDEKTILKIEKTLLDLNTTLIMATHNTGQIDRFFTHRFILTQKIHMFQL